MKQLRQVKQADLSVSDLHALAIIINSYGGGNHPSATCHNVGYATLSFAKQCVRKAIADPKQVDPKKTELATNILEALNIAEKVLLDLTAEQRNQLSDIFFTADNLKPIGELKKAYGKHFKRDYLRYVEASYPPQHSMRYTMLKAVFTAKQ